MNEIARGSGGLGTAIVTGGTGGIGLAIARGLAARGFDVIVTGRTAPTGVPGATGAPGFSLRWVRVDHAAPDAADTVVTELEQAQRDGFGPLTVLVNNVGRRHNDLIGEFDAATLLETLSLNVVSHLMLTQRLVPLFAEAGGSIVNVSSRLAVVGMAGVSGYAASKGAINAFTISAAVELAPKGIRVNAIAPGMTRTALIEQWLAEQPDPDSAEASVTSRIPLGRLAQPDDISSAAVFLASPESSYLTGVILPVDGGYTIG